MSVNIFGIRHHGPGSARSVRAGLAELRPDAILIEGPPDADALIPLAAHAQMQTPVALLIYMPESPNRAVYYPFAEFSPEWQALQYGLAQGVPTRFMDLPQSYQFALAGAENHEQETLAHAPAPPAPSDENAPPPIRQDPLRWAAQAAGYQDSELWWEHLIEERRHSQDVFQAVLELMTALRAEADAQDGAQLEPGEALREAHMRQAIRAATAAGHQKIAIICGAWHAPALAEMPSEKEDKRLLKGLKSSKVAATWTPWTYGRLAFRSGYGAGLASPGYYQHLWTWPAQITVRWLARVAQLLRSEDLDASAASVIEAARLAEALAALRGRPAPGLPELNDAAQAVLYQGDTAPLRLIAEKLIIGERLGRVPDETPTLPLQRDLQAEQKRLRLPPEADARTLDLDLRRPNDLARSQLLHRLNLLNIPWGQAQRGGGGKGTFHELWRVQWQPELAVALIEANVWGNTVIDAATAWARSHAARLKELPALAELVQQVLLADLPEAVSAVMNRLAETSALSSDIPHAMDALPPLVQAVRYGNVRRTGTALVGRVIDGLVTRICIGLPNACASLNEEAAAAMFGRIINAQNALATLNDDAHRAAWQRVLGQLASQDSLHGLLAGRAVRLLLEQDQMTHDAVGQRMSLALSTAQDPARACAWFEGFMRGSGLLLLHHEELWRILNAWLMRLKAGDFQNMLPLLRRTCATFPAPERRQLGERARRGSGTAANTVTATEDFDEERANLILPLAAQLLGTDG